MRGTLIAVTALLCGCVAGTAHAEKRVALIVGNSAYRNVAPLDNPKNDAMLMATTLKGLGFTLVGDGARLDLDRAALEDAVQDFGRQLTGADIGLFYYAGHGVQLRGSNYLVPVNANPTREADVDFQMLNVDLVLNQMRGSGTHLNMILLDACRNNPFGARGLRGAEPGLAHLREVPDDTVIAYATQPGSVAQDGTSGNSPYARALAATMRRPGLELWQVFNEVGLAVEAATGGDQLPWYSNSPIHGRFLFAGESAAARVTPAATATSAAPADTLRLDLVTECDRLAASASDPSRPKGVEGVRDINVQVVPAMTACRDAMRRYPDVARFAYEAGRVAVIDNDSLRARQLFEQAASLGSGAAMNSLGALYLLGEGVEKDPRAARQWFEKAANAGVASAKTNVGRLYLHGMGVSADPVLARTWFERAAASGDSRALAEIGDLYQFGKGVPANPSEALKWYERAAAAEDRGAMNSLGALYEHGTGVGQDLAKSRTWYARAAALGDAHAMDNLGRIYEFGVGVPVNFAMARSWYEKGAAKGSARCMSALGRIYESGRGVAPNKTLAVKWFERAAAAGDEAAKNALQRLSSLQH